MSRRALRLEVLGELALTAAVVAGFVWLVRTAFDVGYLPQPMHYIADDTFMDWVHTSYWAWRRNAYSVWESVYPPISFVFLRMFSLSHCYRSVDYYYTRDCDWLGLTTFMTFYVLNVVLMYISFRRVHQPTALFRTIAMGIGLPMTFALERANLIIPCFTFFVLAYGNIVKSNFIRIISVGIMVNFKPYLVLLTVSYLLKRKWRALELAALSTIGVYLLTLTLNGTGTIGEILKNSRALIRVPEAQFLTEALYSTNYAGLLKFPYSKIPVERFIPSETIELLQFAIPVAIFSTTAIALASLAAIWLQPRAVSSSRIGAIVMLALFTGFVGGQYNYLFMFPLFLVFLGERAVRVGPAIAIIAAYLMSIPADYIAAPILKGTADSWLTGRPVIYEMGITIGQSLRPGLAIIMLWALSLDTIAQVVKGHWRHAPSFGLLDRSDTPPAPFFQRGLTNAGTPSRA